MPTLTIKEAANYFGKSGPIAVQMRKAAHKGLMSAALRMKQVLVTREIPKTMPAPVDKGIYRAGWQVEKLPNGAAVYNAVPYAVFIEYGVSAGNVVASKKFQIALAEWVRRKLGGKSKSVSVRSVSKERGKAAKKTHQERMKRWRERIRDLKRRNALRKRKKLLPLAMPKAPKLPQEAAGATKSPGFDYAWRVAGAIMHAMKKRGIFRQGKGLRILEKFVGAHGKTLVRDEVQRALDKEFA